MVLKSYWVSQHMTLVNHRRMTAIKRGRSGQIGRRRVPLSCSRKVVEIFLGEQLSLDVKVYFKNLPITN